jgi:hypothetical protein
MTSVYKYNNAIIINDGKIGISANCCCECVCTNIANINYSLIITLNKPFGLNCVDVPIEIPINNLINCENGIFPGLSDLDVDLCPEGSCGGIIFNLRLSDPNCNCESGEGCEIELVGWEPDNCPGHIASVQLIKN